MRDWTGPEEKKLARLHEKFSIKYCAEVLNRSVISIKNKADRLGLKPKARGTQQIFFAEDIAHMLELADLGFSHSQIGMCFNTSRWGVNSALSKARKYGFDKYPKREEAN